MSAHRISADLAAANAAGATVEGGDRPALICGAGVPSDTADRGMVYIRMNTGLTGDTVLYTWDDTAGTWDPMTA